MHYVSLKSQYIVWLGFNLILIFLVLEAIYTGNIKAVESLQSL